MDIEDVFWRVLLVAFGLFLFITAIGGGFALSIRLVGVAIHETDTLKGK